MSKLSVIIPSRNEPYLARTIQSVFDNARGEIEVVVHLDGYWPADWQQTTDRYPNLHTVHSGESIGMRGGINKAVASARSRGAKFIAKFDGHCDFGEGFDEVLKAEMEPDWIVVPRRKRLNPETWQLTDTNKPDVDYHYLSFPGDPNDFGGPGLNGKIWPERAAARADILIDDEMSSQGSGWAMRTDYFYRLELMDEASYGKFWNEAQELFLKSWLSGGRCVVNKHTWYAHWHKGKAGRGYHLPESWLQQGASYTKHWIWNEAWDKQTLPFSWLIEHFWPVPSWPENWQEVLYAERKPRAIGQGMENVVRTDAVATREAAKIPTDNSGSLVVHSARYGIANSEPPHQWGRNSIDVADRLRELVKDDSLDIVVNNSTLTPNQNPFRGKRKLLLVEYSYDGGEPVTVQRDEKDWLIIGQAQGRVPELEPMRVQVKREDVTLLAAQESDKHKLPDGPLLEAGKHATRAFNDFGVAVQRLGSALVRSQPPMSATALNDYLIRRFSISPQRLRGPMPIELRDFHRNDLAALFAELGFKRGAEIGVAEGKYSEVLLQANPTCELLLVDPWHAYSGNPQNKSTEKNEYAYNEAVRRVKDYSHVKFDMRLSMNAVRDMADGSLDFCYIDGHHSYPFVMGDVIEWAKRVRSGGIVALDDIYALNEKWGAGPMEAIYDYTRAMKINPWWLINAHKSVDAFFVKP